RMRFDEVFSPGGANVTARIDAVNRRYRGCKGEPQSAPSKLRTAGVDERTAHSFPARDAKNARTSGRCARFATHSGGRISPSRPAPVPAENSGSPAVGAGGRSSNANVRSGEAPRETIDGHSTISSKHISVETASKVAGCREIPCVEAWVTAVVVDCELVRRVRGSRRVIPVGIDDQIRAGDPGDHRDPATRA